MPFAVVCYGDDIIENMKYIDSAYVMMGRQYVLDYQGITSIIKLCK